MPEQGSIPDAGQQPAGVVGFSPTAPAWRTDVGCLVLLAAVPRTPRNPGKPAQARVIEAPGSYPHLPGFLRLFPFDIHSAFSWPFLSGQPRSDTIVLPQLSYNFAAIAPMCSDESIKLGADVSAVCDRPER
jgi:hypothetical protein